MLGHRRGRGGARPSRPVFETGRRHDTRVGDRARRRRGEWFQSRAVPEFGEDGAVEHVLVMNTDITALKRTEAELAHQALHDPLTGLANRALLLDHLELAAWPRRAAGADVAGRAVPRPRPVQGRSTTRWATPPATSCWSRSAERLPAICRAGDTVARLGGDEFVVLLDDLDGPPDRSSWPSASSRRCTRAGRSIDGNEVFTTASVGIAVGQRRPTTTADGLLRDADAAMYLAKARGRDRYRDLRRGPARRRPPSGSSSRSCCAAPIELGELEVYYQPEVELAVGSGRRRRGAGPLAATRSQGLLEAGDVHRAGRGDRAHPRPRRRGCCARRAARPARGSATAPTRPLADPGQPLGPPDRPARPASHRRGRPCDDGGHRAGRRCASRSPRPR